MNPQVCCIPEARFRVGSETKIPRGPYSVAPPGEEMPKIWTTSNAK
jgi:hypothetical protein